MTKKVIVYFFALNLAALMSACTDNKSTDTVIADHVFSNAYIYTADQSSSVVDSLAIANNRIIYVGDKKGVQALIGPSTVLHDLEGKMLLPGFHDVHIHSLAIIEGDNCDFKSKSMSLDEIVHFLKACIQHYEFSEGKWLDVAQWNFYQGNGPSEKYPTLRAALDGVSTKHPIILRGNDGHHYAVNSAALARSQDKTNKIIGLTKNSIDNQYSAYKALIAVDSRGEPSGGLTESAIALVTPPPSFYVKNPAVLMPKIAARLAESGITSIMDALLEPQYLTYFKQLEDSGKMTFRLQAAIKKYYDYPKIEERLKLRT